MQKNNVNEALTFGNHKGATSQPVLLQQLIVKDVTYGFGLTILLSTVHSIQGALLALMNIMKQTQLMSRGE
jgi:hypothetical protein